MSRGYLRRMARQEVWHRNIAAAMGGKSVYETWKIPEFDNAASVERVFNPMTEEEKRIAEKFYRQQQKKAKK